MCLEVLDLGLAETKRRHGRRIHVARNDLQVLRHDVGRQPTLLQGAVEVCHRLRGGGLVHGIHSRGNIDEALLHVVVTHADVRKRTPVHEADSSRGQRLRKLVCRTSSTGGRGSGRGGLVREALDHRG